MNTRRRDDDRPHDDRYKAWNPQVKPADRDYDRRHYRSATIPSQPHDPKSHLKQPPDTRQPTRAYRQEPYYPNTATSASHQPLPGPSSSRAPHPPRSSAQNPPAGYHTATPYHTSTTIQPPHAPPISKGYSAATPSSRRDNTDFRSYATRRAQTIPIPKSSYEQVPSAEDVGRSSRQPYPSRPSQPIQTTANATTPTANWASSTQDAHGKRSKDRDKERGGHREERDKERNVAEPDKDRYREKYRSEVHREKEKVIEGERQREQTRPRNDKRMESDSETLVHPDNASKASLSGREGYQPSIRESITGHRRHRTEDGLLPSMTRRPHAEPPHNQPSVMYMQPTSAHAVVATGSSMPGVGSNPPPAPRVMPVYLPQKPQKSYNERPPTSAAHGGQSNSDAERASMKHRMERHHSGAPSQRGDAHVSSTVRERQVQEGSAGPREDTRFKLEAKHSTPGAYYNLRQPTSDNPADTPHIPLITPGFNSSPLPHESRGHVGTIPILVAGEGPADHQAHDALSKLPTTSRRDELQDARYPHVSHAPVVKPSLSRSQSSEVPQNRSEVPPLDRSRTDPAAVDFSQGRRYGSADPVPPQNASKYPQVTNTVVDHQSSQPRSAHKSSPTNPPGGPRPQPSSSYVSQQNEPTRPVTAATPVPVPISRTASSQPSVPPSPAQKTSSNPAKIGLAYGSAPSTRPTTAGTSQPHLSGTHAIIATSIKRSPSTPPAHPTPMHSSQTVVNTSHSSIHHIPHPSEPPPRPSLDRPEHYVVAPRMTTAQISNGSTVKSSWIVQTAQAEVPLKNGNGYPNKEAKYSPRNRSQPVDPPVVHLQLQEVLSQDYPSQVAQPRAASMQGSPKRSPVPGAPKDINAGPRRTPDSSPHMSKVKEASAPEQSAAPAFPSHVLAPPQIAVIRATPSSMNHDLPGQPQYNTGLLAPSYPAPPRVSRTSSGSRDYQPQPQRVRTQSATSAASHQRSPGLRPQPMAQQAPQPHPVAQQAPHLQPAVQQAPLSRPVVQQTPQSQPMAQQAPQYQYQPSSYSPYTGGQFSPPPLPIPPPRMPGVDIADDIFPIKSLSINPTGTHPPPPTPAPVHTPAFAPSLQTFIPNGHPDSNKNGSRTGDGISTAPPLAQTLSREAAIVTPAEVRMSPPSPVGATGPANGVNQSISDSPHPTPSQGAPAGLYLSAISAPPPKRPKVTIEEVPESPMFMNKWPAPSPLQTHPPTHAQTQSSRAPMQSSSSPAAKVQPSDAPPHSSSAPSANAQPSNAPPHSSSVPAVKAHPSDALPHPSSVPAANVQPPNAPQQSSGAPAAKVQLSEGNAPRSTPPLKPKDVPQPTPTVVTPNHPYTPAPSTQHQAYNSASARPPYSAPPMQSSFSSSYADTLHQSAFSAQPRGYQRPADTLPSVRPPPTPTGAPSTQHMRSASQPMDVPQNALLDAASRETHMKPQSSRPLVSASAAAAQGTQQVTSSLNIQSAPLDAARKQYTMAPTATTATPQPQSLPTVETHTNTESSRPITGASVTAPQVTRPDLHPPNTVHGAPLDSAFNGRQHPVVTAAAAGTPHLQSLAVGETHMKPHSSRPVVPPVTIPQGPGARAATNIASAKSQVQDTPIPNDSARYRSFLSSASRYASAMNPLYPATRHPTQATSNQQSKPPLTTFPNSFHRTVSLPQPMPSSNVNARPPSPRKVSQPPVNSNTTSTQPFPVTSSQANAPPRSTKATEPSWSRVAVSGHPSTPAPSRAHLPAAVNRTFSQESEVLLTPSSIAPSMPKTPQMSSNSVSQATAPAMRQRQASTDSRESKKKPGGFLGGLFRTMSGSSKPLESPTAPVKTFIGVQKSPKVGAPLTQQSKSSSARPSRDRAAAPVAAPRIQTQTAPNPPTSMSAQPQAPRAKTKARVADPIEFPPLHPPREQKQPYSSSVFSQFLFLHSKRKRTVSAASVDVCDGSNTANTVVGSPNTSQIQPLPPMPPIRDPMLATSEWRDKSEAEQQKRKKNRFRPGVTFDVEEDPPHPEKQKGARLVRRKSGRSSATPAPR